MLAPWMTWPGAGSRRAQQCPPKAQGHTHTPRHKAQVIIMKHKYVIHSAHMIV